MPTPSTISRGRSAAQAHPRPRRLSIWRLLLFGDFRQAESHLRATGGSKNEVEAATATGCENGVEGATVPGAVSRTASDSDIELQSPSYPAPKPVLMSQSERKAPSEKQQKRKHGRIARSPSATSAVRIAKISEAPPRSERRGSRLSTVMTYVKDLVVGRCLCRNRQGNHSAKVTMLHADPLVSVDATMYAPGKEIPVDLEIPSLPSERNTLEQISDKCPAEIDIMFRHLSILSLGEELSSTETMRLLHLSAHGTKTPDGKYALVMENECGFADFCLMKRLRKLMKSCSVPECVVISACFSELAAPVFLTAGAKHVVACRKEQRIMDQSARYFNRFFYMALFNGHTVRRAFLIAKANVAAVIDADTPEAVEQAIASDPALDTTNRDPESRNSQRPMRRECHNELEGLAGNSLTGRSEERRKEQEESDWSSNEFGVDNDAKSSHPQNPEAVDVKFTSPGPRILESEKFVLLPEDGDHDVVLFPTPSKLPRGFSRSRSHRRRVSRTPTPMCGPIHPPVPAYALGRHVHVSRCVSLLQAHRCVNIVGRRRIGKSTIAFMCISYVSERCFFADGVFYVDMNAVKRSTERQVQLQDDGEGVPGRVLSAEVRQRIFFRLFLKSMGLSNDPSLEVTSFEELFQAMSHWHCLLVLDNVNSLHGVGIAEQLLSITHKPKVLVTSNVAIELGGGILRQVVVAKELSYGSSRELVRIMAPWKTEQAIHSLVHHTKGCPGSIHAALESEFKSGHAARVH